MRINLDLEASPKAPSALIKLWLKELSKEYCVDECNAYGWMTSDSGRQFVVKFLQGRGWKIDAYTTPPTDGVKSVSYGFFVADDCDQLVAMRLSQS